MPDPRRINYIALDDIAEAARNPKQHDLAGIQTSIARFGFVSPAVIDERTQRLVAGHGRVFALRAMRDTGQDPPAGVRIGTAGVWMVPTLKGWSSRSDVEAEAFLVADNEWTVRGGWDNTSLGEILEELNAADPDLLAITGFTDDDLASLVAGGIGGDDAPAPDVPADPITRPGDLWILSPHRILCGDATDPDDVARVLAGLDPPGIIYADPPYGINAVPKDGGASRGGSVGNRPGLSVSATTYPAVTGDHSAEIVARTFRSLLDAYPAARHAWWGANHYAASAGLPDTSCWLVWDKENGATDFADAELAWTNHRGAVRLLRHLWNGLARASEKQHKRVHPTQKPMALAEWAYGILDPDDSRRVVLDPFGGSGSALLAAHRTARTAAVIEVEPAYVDVMCERWQQETGQYPARDGDVADFIAARGKPKGR
jgi:hypothetical protein